MRDALQHAAPGQAAFGRPVAFRAGLGLVLCLVQRAILASRSGGMPSFCVCMKKHLYGISLPERQGSREPGWASLMLKKSQKIVQIR
jgi:hypothetical protein